MEIKNTKLIPPSPSINVETLSPFTRFCVSIGMLPSSYKTSLTYEEQLLWLCNYLEETIIPSVNNNGEAVAELQALYIELKNYVDNYFTSLDVQEEINNKLDQMVEDGTLTNLINAYIQPRIEAQNIQINSIDNKVNSIASGSPAGVYATLSALQQADPNHDKIYVVEDNGEWYFWNSANNQWKSGGVYQSSVIDPDSVNLINMVRGRNYISNVPGLSSATPVDESNNNLNTITNNRIDLYYVLKDTIQNTPDIAAKNINSNLINLFYMTSYGYTSNSPFVYQVLFDIYGANMFIRKSDPNLTGWSEWEKVTTTKSSIDTDNLFIYSQNLTEEYKNLNNLKRNTIFYYYLRKSQMLNCPEDFTETLEYFTIMTLGYNEAYRVQVIYNSSRNKMYYRNMNNNVWTEWKKLLTLDDLKTYGDSILKPFNFNNKSIVAFGDSITAGVTSPNLAVTQNSYIKLFANKVGANLTNNAVSGSFITDGDYTNTSIFKKITSYTGTPDYIIISGGINDYAFNKTLGTYDSTDVTTFYGSLKAICESLKTNQPNTNVIFLTPANITKSYSNPNSLNDYRNAIFEVASKYKFSVVDGSTNGLPNTPSAWANELIGNNDGVHPTELGHYQYFKTLCGKLL